MCAKSAIALATTLGTFVFAVPVLSTAENQFEWVERQLQMTDGYAPPPVVARAARRAWRRIGRSTRRVRRPESRDRG